MCAVLRSGRLRSDSVRRYRLEMGWTALVAGNRARHTRLANRARIHPRYGDDDRIVTPAPPIARRSNAFQRVVNAVAAALLRAGRVGMSGTAPNGHRFAWGPRRIWTIANSHAVLHGVDLGPPHPLPRELHLVDFWLPQRGLFAVSDSAFENFDPTQHALPSNRRPNHKQEEKIHDHTAHPCRQRRKRRRAVRRPLGVARYTGTRSVQMADNGFVDRRHPQLVHRLTPQCASHSGRSRREAIGSTPAATRRSRARTRSPTSTLPSSGTARSTSGMSATESSRPSSLARRLTSTRTQHHRFQAGYVSRTRRPVSLPFWVWTWLALCQRSTPREVVKNDDGDGQVSRLWVSRNGHGHETSS